MPPLPCDAVAGATPAAACLAPAAVSRALAVPDIPALLLSVCCLPAAAVACVSPVRMRPRMDTLPVKGHFLSM